MFPYYYGGFGFPGGDFLMILFWVALILFILWLFSHRRDHYWPPRVDGPTPPPISKNESDTALEILRQRYAKGEINKEEFEEKKRDLETK